MLNELGRIAPSECIANEAFFSHEYLKKRFQNVCYLEKEPDSVFQNRRAQEVLKDHFGVNSLEGFGLSDCTLAVCAAGALMQYLRDTQKNELSHIRKLSRIVRSSFMQLDSAARRNLELTEPLRFGGSKKIHYCFCWIKRRRPWVAVCSKPLWIVRCKSWKILLTGKML